MTFRDVDITPETISPVANHLGVMIPEGSKLRNDIKKTAFDR